MAVKSFLGADNIDEWRPKGLACRWGDVSGDSAGNNADSSAASYSGGDFSGGFDSADSWSSIGGDSGSFNGGSDFSGSGVSFGDAGVGSGGFGTGNFGGAFDGGGYFGGGSDSNFTGDLGGGGGWGTPSFSDYGGGGFGNYGGGIGGGAFSDYGGTFGGGSGIFSDPGWSGYSGVSYADAPFSAGWSAYNGAPAFEAGSFGGPSWGISGPGDVFGGFYGGLYGGALEAPYNMGALGGLNDMGVTEPGLPSGLVPGAIAGGALLGSPLVAAFPAAAAAMAGHAIPFAAPYVQDAVQSANQSLLNAAASRDYGELGGSNAVSNVNGGDQFADSYGAGNLSAGPGAYTGMGGSNFGPGSVNSSELGETQSHFGPTSQSMDEPGFVNAFGTLSPQTPDTAGFINAYGAMSPQSLDEAGWINSSLPGRMNVDVVNANDIPGLANPLATTDPLHLADPNELNPHTPSMSLPPIDVNSSKIGELVGTPGQVAPSAPAAPAQGSMTSGVQGQGAPSVPMAPPASPSDQRTAEAARSLLDMTPQQMNAALLEAAKPGSVQPPTVWDRVADFFSPSQAEAGNPLSDIVKALRTGPFAAIPGDQVAQQAQQAARDQQWFSKGATPTDKYLSDVYNRTPQKVDSTGDFTWKDAAAANYYGKGTAEYAIGGLHPDFKTVLEAMGRAMDRAGIPWSISAAYRDNARQAITQGFRASTTGSMHGGTGRLGGDRNNPLSTYGRGQAIDVTGVERGPQKNDNNQKVWDFIDKYGQQFGVSRPMKGSDPPHLQPTAKFQQIAEAIRGGYDPMTSRMAFNPTAPAAPAQAGRGPGASQDNRSAFGPPHLTAYAPGTGGRMEGGENAKWMGPDGTNRAHTAEDVRAARERGGDDYVTLAKHDRSPYKVGQEINIPVLRYQDRNGNWQTLENVKGVVHDRGTAKALRGGALDVATFSGKGLTDKEAKSLLAQGVKTDAQVAAAPPPPQAAPPAIRPTAPVPNIPGITAPTFQATAPAAPPLAAGWLASQQSRGPAFSGWAGVENPLAGGQFGGLPGAGYGENYGVAGPPIAPPSGVTGSPAGLPGSREFQPPPTGSPAGLPGTYNPTLPEAMGSPPGLPGQLPEAPEGPTGSPPGLPGVLPASLPPPLERGGGSLPGLPGVLPSRGATGSPAGLPGARESQPPPTGSPPGLPGTLPAPLQDQGGGSPAGLPGSESDYGAYGPGAPATGSPGGLPGSESDYSGYGREGVPVSAMPTGPAAPTQFGGPANPAFKSEPMLAPSRQFDVNSKTISTKFNLSEADKKAGKDFLKGLSEREATAIIEGKTPIIAVIERRATEAALRGDFGTMAQMAAKTGMVDIAGKAREYVQQNYPGGIAGLQRDATHRDMTQPTPSGIQSELARPGGAEVYDEQTAPTAVMPTAPAAPPSGVPSWMATPSANTTQPGSLADMFGAGFVPGGQFSGFTPGGGNFGGRGATGTWDAKGDLQPNDFNSRFGDWGGQQAFQPAVQQAQQEAQSNPQQAQQIAQANPQAVQQIAQQLGIDLLTAAMVLSMEERPRLNYMPPNVFESRGQNGGWPLVRAPDFPGLYSGLGREIWRQNYNAQNPLDSQASMLHQFQFNPASWDAVLAHAPYSQNVEDRRNQSMIGMR